MTSTGPFIDRESGGLDTDQMLQEAYPLVGLILLFAGLALIPFMLTLLLFGNTVLGLGFSFLTQLVLAVGAAIVLMYVIARAIQLANNREDR